MRRHLRDESDIKRISQWLMDEGSVSLAHFPRGDYTALIVCGSMNDYSVLSSISTLLETPITSSKAPSATTLPMGAVRVQGARAYALLEILKGHLVGLKGSEATAALKFFPPSGRLRGRHTTDEFLLPVWEDFARKSLLEWNSRRRTKMSPQEIDYRATAWLAGRVRRARRFLDRQGSSPEIRPVGKQL